MTMNEDYRKRTVNARTFFAATALAAIVLTNGAATASALPASSLATTEMQQQRNTVSGQVTDAQGEPIIGASIVIKGTTKGAVTDVQGHFTIDVAPGQVIEISCIGFEKQAVKVSG